MAARGTAPQRQRRPTRRPGRFAGALIRGIIYLFSKLPLGVARSLSAALAGAAWRFGYAGKTVAIANVAHCQNALPLADSGALARDAARQTAWLFAEQGVVWHWPRSRWAQLIDDEPFGDQLRQLTAGDAQGVLLLVPHLGNWELFSLYLGGFGVTALYDPPRLMSLDAPIRDARERNGATLLPIDRSGLTGRRHALDHGGLVALLPDQVPDRNAGVYAPFFGQPALTMTLAHRLIRRSAPRVLVGALLRQGDRFRVVLEAADAAIADPDPVVSARAMNAALEALIAQAPEQYQWGYKRFKRLPPEHPRLY